MRIRLRGPSGQSTLTLAENATVGELKSKISDATGLSYYNVKTGIPPQPLEVLELDAYSEETTISEASLKLANALLIVSAEEEAALPATKTSQQVTRSADVPTPSTPAPQQGSLLNLEKKKLDELQDPPEVEVPEWGLKLMLRVMPDDNSCLFRALGTCVLSEDIESATELRDVVATRIQDDPSEFTEAILGMRPDEYCRKIKDPDAWGGEIEIRIIAEAFGIGVDAIDVETQHVYSYNQDAPTRCIIIYSGIHYDTVALGGPGVPDVKQFPGSEYDSIREKAIEICQILKGRHYYTNTSNFSIKCEDCGWRGAGEKDAQNHNKRTGHYNFSEA